MNFAIACRYIDTNPAHGLKKNRRPPLTRFLSREEIGRLHRVLDKQTGKSSRPQADIIRLLLLTGCRRSEIVQLRWSEVQNDKLVLVDSKTGPRTVPLNTHVQVDSRPAAANREFLRVPIALPTSHVRALPASRSGIGSGGKQTSRTAAFTTSVTRLRATQ